MSKVLWMALGVLFAASASAQMYRWVDKDGSVHYTDHPPPPTAKKSEEKKFSTNIIQSDKLPYASQLAMKNYPVTLFTGDCGELCIQAKAYLTKRGVPFTERLPRSNQADSEMLKKIMPDLAIPVLMVGNSIPLKGFVESSWASALDAAGYPKSNPVAPSQRTEPAKPAAPQQPAANANAQAPKSTTPAASAPAPDNARKSY